MRRSSLAPARLLIGSLVLGGGIVALGLLFGGGTANAAEPPAPDPLGGVVASVHSVTAGVGDAAGAAVAAVTPAAPAPVRDVAAQVAQPVASSMRHVAEAAPVEAVVSPVAQAADQVVAAPAATAAPIAAAPAPVAPAPGTLAPAPGTLAPAPQTSILSLPLMRALVAPLSVVTSALADHPVSTLTAPITAAADGVLTSVAGAVAEPVQPLTVLGVPVTAGEGSAIQPADVGPAVAASPPPGSAGAATALRAAGAPYPPALAPASGATSARLGDAARGDSGVSPSGVVGTNSAGGQAAGSGSGVAALGGGSARLADALSVRAALPADDDLPASPVFAHDSSPD